MEKESIKKHLIRIGPSLFARYEIELAYLFGSANSGRFTAQSDIDIAVQFKPMPTKNDFLRLSALLQTELTKLLQWKVDVAVLNLANSLLRYEVVKNGAVIFSIDEEQRALFHIRVYRDYEDFCHVQNFYIQALRERLKQVPHESPCRL